MILKLLTDQQIEKIHNSSLYLLEKVGVVIPHDELLSRFKEWGADVEINRKKVKIPSELTMDLIKKAKNRFTLYGRDLKKKAQFGETKRNYNTTAGQASWIEKIGENRRYSTFEDVSSAVKFAEALENINLVGAMADPHEIPVEWRCVAVAHEMIKYTSKPIYFWLYDRASAKWLVELLKTLRGDEKSASKHPLFFPLLEPVSPLSFPFEGIDLLLETSRLNIPVVIGPMAQMGMTAPATIAGTMIQENAEILAGICVTQLIKEGIPVCYGGICHAFDMKAIQMIFSGPEQAKFSIAMSQMGKFYNLPVYINVGLTDSKTIDAQAGLECGLTLAMGVAAGGDIFGHFGICGVDQGSSLEMLVMQHEIISYIENMSKDILFDEETLALNLFEEIGPGGTFTDNLHTVKHFRKELWFPTLLDRNYYDTWIKDGAKDMRKRCNIKKEEIISNYEASFIEEDINRDLEKIVLSAKKELSKA